MTTSTTQLSTQQALQDIAQAEAQSREHIERARSMATEEEAAYIRKEEERLAQSKHQIKKECDAEIVLEEKKNEQALAEGLQKVQKEKEALESNSKDKKTGVIAWITEQFLSLSA